MRFANISDRLAVITTSDTVIDVEKASGGRFGARIQDCYQRWDELLEFAAGVEAEGPALSDIAPGDFGNPSPAPRQIFAIGLNYAEHAAESAFAVPEEPPVFTKFATSLAGPYGTVTLPPGGNVDWEVELVVVIGRRGHRISAADAWSHVAGLSVGQDISERDRQRVGPAPQFSMGKSFPGFGPIGPMLVTPDEFYNPDDLELGCLINGEQMQKGKTSDMVFPVSALIERLSAITPLLPGDVIFTGTPSGVGIGRSPERFLAPGDELVSYVRGIGEMRHLMVTEN